MGDKMNEYEVRSGDLWPDADFELRATGDGLTLEGYAAVFNLPSLPMAFADIEGGRRFREVIHSGAFTRSLNAKPDMTLRYQHSFETLPLARTKSGTLNLEQDERGLKVSAGLPDNEWGRPIRDAIQRGDISGMSFRFARNPKAKWEKVEDGYERHLLEVNLGPEVSIVDYPAYPDTSVFVRMAEEADVEPDALAAVFAALRDPEARLTVEQRDVLMAVVNTKVDEPFIPPKLARLRERLSTVA